MRMSRERKRQQQAVSSKAHARAGGVIKMLAMSQRDARRRASGVVCYHIKMRERCVVVICARTRYVARSARRR